MTSFAEIVATVVVHSSSAALSHFGVVVAPTPVVEHPAPVERVVARSPRPIEKLDCPTSHRAPAHTAAMKA